MTTGNYHSLSQSVRGDDVPLTRPPGCATHLAMACCLLPPCCSCCNVHIKCCGHTRVDWRWAYFSVFGASVVLSWTFRDYAAPHLTVFTGATEEGTSSLGATNAHWAPPKIRRPARGLG